MSSLVTQELSIFEHTRFSIRELRDTATYTARGRCQRATRLDSNLAQVVGVNMRERWIAPGVMAVLPKHPLGIRSHTSEGITRVCGVIDKPAKTVANEVKETGTDSSRFWRISIAQKRPNRPTEAINVIPEHLRDNALGFRNRGKQPI